MHIQRSVRFLSHTLTVGLAAAIVLLLLLPESKQENPVVQIHNATVKIKMSLFITSCSFVQYVS